MNTKRTKKAIQALGMTARRRDGEWRINYRNGREETAYYTNDNADALQTAQTMATASVTHDDEAGYQVDGPYRYFT